MVKLHKACVEKLFLTMRVARQVVHLMFEHYDRTSQDISLIFQYVRRGYKYCRTFDSGGIFTQHILSLRPLTHAEARSIVRHLDNYRSSKPHPKFTIL